MRFHFHKLGLLALGLMLTATLVGATKVRETNTDDRVVHDDLVVHEWGTFTTFSGSDGVLLEYRPLAGESDLPSFVRTRADGTTASRFSKRRLFGRVRMETPVTYFYTDQIRQVDVSVEFPQGLLTEYYPPVKSALPEIDVKKIFSDGEPVGNGKIDWGTVTLIPQSKLVPDLPNADTRQLLGHRLSIAGTPSAPNDDHYAAARKTDSALVYVNAGADQTTGIGYPSDHHLEKFLFYRGVGQFEMPLRAASRSDGTISMTNAGNLPIPGAIYVSCDGERLLLEEIPLIAAGEVIQVQQPQAGNQRELETRMTQLLVRQGLYEKEAKAMVATWKKSWFTEPGTRVLYVVPEEITDQLLPLNISPRPTKQLRVLIGRMEIMTADEEHRMQQQVLAYAKARKEFAKIPDNRGKQLPIPEEIHRFGRMTEPALSRVAALAKDHEIREEAKRLIEHLRSAS